MIFPQPSNIFKYIHIKQMNIPGNIHRYFYTSWEDALWDLLVRYNIPKQSVVLIPSFFCMDVVKNMKTHGLVPIFYEMDAHFNVDISSFISDIKTYKPAVIVIFHPVGMTSSLMHCARKWIHELSPDTLLVEDCVHHIVDPSTIRFMHAHHFVIDSLRKVVPLPGSNMFSSEKLPEIHCEKQNMDLYAYKVIFWWVLFQLCATLSYVPIPRILQQKVLKYTETCMLLGYDVIGDKYTASKGWKVFSLLWTYLDIPKIKHIKKHQVQLYIRLLNPLRKHMYIYYFPIKKQEYCELRGFPLGISYKHAKQWIFMLRSKNVFMRLELDDSPWAKRQKVIYLPLGPHITDQNILDICSVVLDTSRNI